MAGEAARILRLTGARRTGESERWSYAGTHIDVFSGHINMLRHLYFVLRIDNLSDISSNKQLSIVL